MALVSAVVLGLFGIGILSIMALIAITVEALLAVFFSIGTSIHYFTKKREIQVALIVSPIILQVAIKVFLIMYVLDKVDIKSIFFSYFTFISMELYIQVIAFLIVKILMILICSLKNKKLMYKKYLKIYVIGIVIWIIYTVYNVIRIFL